MLITPSASGSGSGVSLVGFSNLMNVSASFDYNGTVSFTGDKTTDPDAYKATQATKLSSVLGNGIIEAYSKLHWTDLMALSLAVNSPKINSYTGRIQYMAGKRGLDATSLVLIAKEIAAGNGKSDWNLIMKRKAEVDPVIEDTITADSPFNPLSGYYNPDKPIFTYDPDYGYIIYKSGEIVWTKTAGQYYDAVNGQAVSYNKFAQTVDFEFGAKLNLRTLQLTTAEKQVITVKNTLPWYQQIFRQLLSDSKTQYSVLGALFILLFIKSKQSKYAN